MATLSQNFPSIRDIAKALENWAPRGSAQSYDNVGLQVGDAQRPVERSLIALDLTPAVLEEAKSLDASLIITHHPLLFRPLKTLTPVGFVNTLAFRLAESGIALYSIHTNLDAASGGVSFALAEQLGLKNVRFLDSLEDSLHKLVLHVPTPQLGTVRKALMDSGIDRMGEHDHTSHAPGGIAFKATTLELTIAKWDVASALRAVQSVLPSGEVTYDVFPVLQKNEAIGLGAIGELEQPTSLSDFLGHVAKRLNTKSLRYVGTGNATVRTVAVCGGSGSSFTQLALRAGVDAYVTADITYHKFFDVLDAEGTPQMALIDAGHYETEAITEELLLNWLRGRFPSVHWQRTQTRTSPMDTYVAPS